MPINLTTHKVGTPITVGPVNASPSALAVTPNGQTLYVANQEPGVDTVVPISTATGTAGTPINVGTQPDGLAIAPDGQTVYVANEESASVTPISTPTNSAGTPISLPGTDPARPGPARSRSHPMARPLLSPVTNRAER